MTATQTKRMGLSLLVVAGLALPALGATGVDEVLAFVESKVKDLNSWSADVSIAMPMPTMQNAEGGGGSMVQTGTVSAKKPNLIRMTLQMSMGEMSMGTLVVNDGTTIWTEQNMNGRPMMVMKMSVASAMAQAGSQAGGNFQWDEFLQADKLKAQFDIKDLGQETIGNARAYVLEMTPRNAPPSVAGAPAGMTPGPMRIAFDTQTGMPVKMDLFSSQGATMAAMTYTNYRLNPNLSDSLFQYAPPPNVKVMDMSGGMPPQGGDEAPAPQQQ